jgi:hypothetical protein
MLKKSVTYRILEYKPSLFKIQRKKYFFWVNAFGVPLTTLKIAQERLQEVIKWDASIAARKETEKNFKKRVWQVV